MKLKLFIFALLVLLFTACGVDTSSSQTKVANDSTVVNGGNSGGDLSNLDLIDPNPVTLDGNISNPDLDPDMNVTDSGGLPSDPTFQYLFDQENAILDFNACDATKYRFARDASYNGDVSGANGSTFSIIDGQGLEINSEYNVGDVQKQDKTFITVFYKTFPDVNSLNLQGYTNFILAGIFSISYDIAWSDKSIGGIDNILYVQSLKTTIPSCYRLELNNIDGTQLSAIKVTRYIIVQ